MRHDPRRAQRPGFTLIELLVVVAIIAVLVGILVPAIGGARNSARKAATTSLLTSVSTGISQFRTAQGRLPGYFTAAEMGNDTANGSGFTQMENALLDLMGGVLPASASTSDPQKIDVAIGAKVVKIDVLGVGSPDGPGYLSLPAKGIGSNVPAANGLSTARPGLDQETTIPAGKYQMPDVIDSWGKPVMLWSKNESAGAGATLAQITSANPGLFYWHSNAGYLNAPSQRATSIIGGDADLGAGDETNLPDVRRSLEGFLGHAGFPRPTSDNLSDGGSRPAAPKGDFVLVSAGVDGVFANNKKTDQGAIKQVRYLPKGAEVPSGWSSTAGEWIPPDALDDILLAGE